MTSMRADLQNGFDDTAFHGVAPYDNCCLDSNEGAFRIVLDLSPVHGIPKDQMAALLTAAGMLTQSRVPHLPKR